MMFFHTNAGKRSRFPKWAATANRDLTDRSSLLAAMPTSTAKPAYLSSVNDPVYGTKITRVSGDPGTTNNGVTWGTQARWHYSADQAWNADESMMMIQDNSGGSASPAAPVLIDGQTYTVIQAASSPPYDFRWHPTDPAHCIYVQSTGAFGLWNPETGSQTTMTTFTGYTACTIGGGNGSINFSYQTKSNPIVPFLATRTSDSKVVAFTYDLLAGTKSVDIASGTGQGWGGCWVSHDGTYLIITDIGPSDTYDAQYVYNRTSGALVGGPYGSTTSGAGAPSESDYTYDGTGVGFQCGVNKSSSGQMMKRQLSNGTLTNLTASGPFLVHASCQGWGYPGWVLGTFYGHNDGADAHPLYLGEIVAFQIDGTGNPYRLCHHFSWNSGASYYAQVQTTWSPTGTRLAWKGNWGDPNGTGFPVQCYVADLR